MALPRLIHPIKVVIKPIDKALTKFDDDARSVVGAVHYGTPYTIQAQIQWSRDRSPIAQRGGDDLVSDGYILVRYKDVQRLGVEINKGDQIAKMGKTVVNLRIEGFAPAGHYPDQDGASLLQVDFVAR